MTDEEKKIADSTFEASLEGLSDEEKNTKRTEREGLNTNKPIDYEALLKEEQERADKAEDALSKKRFAESEKRRKEKEAREALGEEHLDEEVDEDDKPLTQKALREILDREEHKTNVKLMSKDIEKFAEAISTSEAEKKLIILKHSQMTFPSDYSLEDQIEATFSFVNRKKFIGERNEALRAIRGKNSTNGGGESVHHDPVDLNKGEPKLPPAQASNLKNSGFEWNNGTKLYEKKLPNGAVLIHNHKTKQNYFQKKS